jgi:anti-sigma factor RsiW
MDCKKALALLDAYLDGELDLSASLELEAHLAECAACRARREALAGLRGRLRAGLTRHAAPQDLRARLAQLAARPAPAAAPGPAPLSTPGPTPLFTPGPTPLSTPGPTPAPANTNLWQRRQFMALAASVLLAVVASGGTTYLVMRPAPEDPLAEEVVGSHIRSLMADHLIDVASSDQHTVKPWFDGRLDLAPAVVDLKAQGFTLLGGRLDYIDRQPVAAVVYQRGKHLINLFAWPSGGTPAPLRAMTIRGYNVLSWTAGDLAYWAFSDVNPKDLATLQRLIAENGAPTPD